MKPIYRLDHWLFCDVPPLCLIRIESSCLRFELGGKYLRPYFSANRKICATFSWLPGMSFWIARQEVWTMSHGCHATNHDSYTRPSKIPKQARNINLHILKPSYHPGPNMATNLKYEWLLKRPLTSTNHGPVLYPKCLLYPRVSEFMLVPSPFCITPKAGGLISLRCQSSSSLQRGLTWQ